MISKNMRVNQRFLVSKRHIVRLDNHWLTGQSNELAHRNQPRVFTNNTLINSSNIKIRQAHCTGYKIESSVQPYWRHCKRVVPKVSHLFEESRRYFKPYSKSDPRILPNRQMKCKNTTRSFILASAASNDSLYFFCFCLSVARPLTFSLLNFLRPSVSPLHKFWMDLTCVL